MSEQIDSLQTDFVKILNVTNVNHKPHPFTIGPRHVAYASDHYCGMIGKETFDAVPCAVKGCRLPYDQHTSDRVVFLQLKRNCTKEEMTTYLRGDAMADFMAAEKADGVIFVETPEKYRIGE